MVEAESPCVVRDSPQTHSGSIQFYPVLVASKSVVWWHSQKKIGFNPAPSITEDFSQKVLPSPHSPGTTVYCLAQWLTRPAHGAASQLNLVLFPQSHQDSDVRWTLESPPNPLRPMKNQDETQLVPSFSQTPDTMICSSLLEQPIPVGLSSSEVSRSEPSWFKYVHKPQGTVRFWD